MTNKIIDFILIIIISWTATLVGMSVFYSFTDEKLALDSFLVAVVAICFYKAWSFIQDKIKN